MGEAKSLSQKYVAESSDAMGDMFRAHRIRPWNPGVRKYNHKNMEAGQTDVFTASRWNQQRQSICVCACDVSGS
jgi:hypothetical protein